jgi:hypothetical protein
MRSPVVGLAIAGLALAACGEGQDAGPSPDPGPATALAECVVGDWTSVGVDATAGGELAQLSAAGGSQVALTVGADGAARVDFSGMAPVTVDGDIFGAEVAGEVSYSGPASGTVRTDTGATSGGWETVDSADWSGVRVTVELTEPLEATPFEGAAIGDIIESADNVTGEVVDVDPILAEGTFECQDDRLTLAPAGDGLTWTFRRA